MVCHLKENYEANHKNKKGFLEKSFIKYKYSSKKLGKIKKQAYSWPPVRAASSIISPPVKYIILPYFKYIVLPIAKKIDRLPNSVKAGIIAVSGFGSAGIGPSGGWNYAKHFGIELYNHICGNPANFGVSDIEKIVGFGGGYLFFQTVQFASTYSLGCSFYNYISKQFNKSRIKKDLSQMIADAEKQEFGHKINNQNF